MKSIQTAVQVVAVLLAWMAAVLAVNLLVALFCLLELAKLARLRIRSIISLRNTAFSARINHSTWKRQRRS